MSDEKVTNATVPDDDAVSSKEVKKRATYPAKDLKTIIDFVGKVYTQLGHTAFHSNKSIALIHGFVPESIKQHLSSAQQYKLLELKHGVGYKTTDHFQKVFLPKNDGEKRLAIIESLKSAEAYQQLFKDYEYHVVPVEGVRNHFIRTFGFKEDVATKAAQVFMDNLKDFQLLDGRGVLTSALPVNPALVENSEVTPIEPINSNKPENGVTQLPSIVRKNTNKVIFQSELEASGKKTIPIYLTDDKEAVLVYPDEITENDIELIQHQIQGILLRIKFESKKQKKDEEPAQKEKRNFLD